MKVVVGVAVSSGLRRKVGKWRNISWKPQQVVDRGKWRKRSEKMVAEEAAHLAFLLDRTSSSRI